MQNLALSEVYRVIEPGPVVLVSTMRNGRPNLMTMSWHMMVDFEPPLIACVVSDGNYSFKALAKNRACVIAVPPASLARKVIGIGNCHGDQTDKFARFSLTPVPSSRVKAPLVKECFVNLECRVTNDDLVGRYGLFILRVVKAWHDPRKKRSKTLHHHGFGEFRIDGRVIRLPSKMR